MKTLLASSILYHFLKAWFGCFGANVFLRGTGPCYLVTRCTISQWAEGRRRSVGLWPNWRTGKALRERVNQSSFPRPPMRDPGPRASVPTLGSTGHPYLTPLAFLCPKVQPRIMLMCSGVPAPSLRGPAHGCLLARSGSGISEGLKINSRECPTHCPQELLLPWASPGPSVPSRPPTSFSAPTWAPMRRRGNPLEAKHHEGWRLGVPMASVLEESPNDARLVICAQQSFVSHWTNPLALCFPPPFPTIGKERMSSLLAMGDLCQPWHASLSKTLVSFPEPSTSSSCPQHWPSLNDMLVLTFSPPMPYQSLNTCF